MGVMTLTDFRREVEYELLAATNLQTSGDPLARLDRWVNWAYLHVSMPSIYRHRELQETDTVTLATNDFDYDLEADLVALYSVSNSTDGYRLQPEDIREFDRRVRFASRPVQYALWGRVIYLFPTPSSGHNGDTLTIRGWKRPTLLSDTSDTTVIQAEWDEVIVTGAKWRAWVALDELDRAVEAERAFGLLINEVTDQLRIDTEDWPEFDVETLDAMPRGAMR